VRSQIGQMELDTVQSNRSALIDHIRDNVASVVDDWGIEVTRAEILDVNLDEATRAAMLQQLNAERARRAQVTEAEGRKRAVELSSDAELYAAAQFQIALKQVEALTAVGKGEGKQTVILPAAALDAFSNAFTLLKGKL
jgi:regulator of protease activity HflC (stomatin/prohibitin superfamily)